MHLLVLEGFVVADVLQTSEILVVTEKNVGFVNHESLQRAQVDWLSRLQRTLNLSVSRHNDLGVGVSSHCHVLEGNVRALDQLFVDGSNLIAQLSSVANADNLWLFVRWIYSQHRSDGESTGLT